MMRDASDKAMEEITLKDKLRFIRSIMIPFFLLGNDDRMEWMREEAKKFGWKSAKSDELINIYSVVQSLDEARTTLEKVMVKVELEKVSEMELTALKREYEMEQTALKREYELKRTMEIKLMEQARTKRMLVEAENEGNNSVCPLPFFSPIQIKGLWRPKSGVSPSSVKSEEIQEHQLDDTYYSPCTNSFVLRAHILAFEDISKIQSALLDDQIDRTCAHLDSAFGATEQLGYFKEDSRNEGGITAVLTARIAKCFSEYCRCQALSEAIDDQVSIMHQTTASNGNVDIALYYDFLEKDKEKFVHQVKALFPFVFIEFTKQGTKTVDKKVTQAALYANHLLRQMDFEERRTWVPLLGIIMSEKEMLLKVYSPTVVESSETSVIYEWRISEVSLRRCQLSSESLKRLVHIMAGWTRHCVEFLCSESAKPVPDSINEHVLLQKHVNHLEMGGKLFKCFDYRAISKRRSVLFKHRRRPDVYLKSGLPGVKLIVDWESGPNSTDTLKIITYDKVEGSHSPSCIGHFAELLGKLKDLHDKGIVHGDLHFWNVIFSEPSESIASTIIDFDYSGEDGTQVYPPRFNTIINHGFRHKEVKRGDPLKKHHDIGAVHWMLEQYRPKKAELRNVWVSCLQALQPDDLGSYDLNGAILCLSSCQEEEIEPAASIGVDDEGGNQGTGSPDPKR